MHTTSRSTKKPKEENTKQIFLQIMLIAMCARCVFSSSISVSSVLLHSFHSFALFYVFVSRHVVFLILLMLSLSLSLSQYFIFSVAAFNMNVFTLCFFSLSWGFLTSILITHAIHTKTTLEDLFSSLVVQKKSVRQKEKTFGNAENRSVFLKMIGANSHRVLIQVTRTFSLSKYVCLTFDEC